MTLSTTPFVEKLYRNSQILNRHIRTCTTKTHLASLTSTSISTPIPIHLPQHSTRKMSTQHHTSNNNKKYNVFSSIPLPHEISSLFHSPHLNLIQYQPPKEGALISADEFKGSIQQQPYHGILLTLNNKIDENIIQILQQQNENDRCRVVSTMSVGYDHIDVKACTKNNILVGYTPTALTETTADLCVALTLATCRRVIHSYESILSSAWLTTGWSPFSYTEHTKDLHSSTIGIIGCGRIGLSVARRLKHGFGCPHVLYYKRTRYSKDIEQQYGIEYCEMNRLLQQSDIVIPLTNVNADTKGMFNKQLFQQMKRSALFINITRGALVNQEDLIDALNNNTIAGAGLDVMTPEPMSPDHPLIQLSKDSSKNLTVLPHIGSATTECRMNMLRQAAMNIVNALSDQLDGGDYVNRDEIQSRGR